MSEPRALAFDSSGNLYVANEGNSTVSLFAAATPAAGGVVIQSSVESRPMLIGGTNSSPVAGINLTSAELAQIYTSSTGTVTVGDSSQTGNITFSTATPATTAGATLNVIQSTTSSGQIILDDGAGTATALNGNGGNISIAAGTGGIVALAASNSTAEIGTTGGSVTLLTSGPIGTSTNRIQFSDDSNTSQQVVSIGSTSIQPSSVYLDGLGSLTLDNILGGTSNPTVDVTARTNLVVASGATINAGSGSIKLGADLTTNETGYGSGSVGSLAIASGAEVLTTGAITLRGAAVNIATGEDAAHVGGQVTGVQTTVSNRYTGLVYPGAVAVDASGDVYVANLGNNTVSKFLPGASTPSLTLTGLDYASSMAFDSSGNLFVVDGYGSSISEFTPGATTPTATLTGLSNPLDLAFGPDGSLYVGNTTSNTVSKFAPGATTAGTILTGLNDPVYLAFDSSGDLYVANESGNTVSEFAPGTTIPTTTLVGLSSPNVLAIDSSGNVYVSNSGNNTVSRFAPGATTSAATLTGINSPQAMAVDAEGNLYVANDLNSGSVSVFAPGATTATATLGNLRNPYAMTIDGSGNVYVTENFGGQVSEFPVNVVPEASSVTIQSSVESRPMLIGGSNSSPVAGINLTSAELAQIYTTSTGTVTFGDSNQTGNITLSTATPATTAGATLNVIQSTTGSGQIILDDGAGTSTALIGNGGNISITAGTGGIVALAASNNTAEIATTGAGVTLLTSGPIGTSTNRIQFADNSNTAQQIVSIGSTSIQPSSVYLDGLGSLTLGNVLGGTSNATIDITARTNLVVSAGATINSGASTLSLGADLTVAEAGDNGVGTLTVSSGATVVTTGAITLRGAAVNIATGITPALVRAKLTGLLSSTPTTTLTGLDAPTRWPSTPAVTCSWPVRAATS